MKGDKFREMAARCGELPDSVMAVPGLEYVGARSARWEALAIRAFYWANDQFDDPDPELSRAESRIEWARGHYIHDDDFAGFALFARLMAIVTREE